MGSRVQDLDSLGSAASFVMWSVSLIWYYRSEPLHDHDFYFGIILKDPEENMTPQIKEEIHWGFRSVGVVSPTGKRLLLITSELIWDVSTFGTLLIIV